MNTSMKALIISLAFHGAFLSLVYALSVGFAQPCKPIRIDFTVTDSAPGPPFLKPPGAASSKARGPTPPKIPRKPAHKITPKPAANWPCIAAPVPLGRPSAPLTPATEQAGPVPSVTTHRETLPVPGASYSKEVGITGGGKGTTATGGVGNDDGVGGGGNGGGGGSGGAEQLRSRYRKEHFEYIRKIIREHIVYPPRAQLNRWQGTVVVMFCVMQSGNAKDIRIRTSSGYYMLDKNVIETIRKVEPFPKPPVTVELIIPVEYRL